MVVKILKHLERENNFKMSLFFGTAGSGLRTYNSSRCFTLAGALLPLNGRCQLFGGFSVIRFQKRTYAHTFSPGLVLFFMTGIAEDRGVDDANRCPFITIRVH
jgi:hypothetical protein